MITVKNLVKRYGSMYALDDVSFHVEEGEIVGLLGQNGAGKSTTMNILTGFLAMTQGQVLVDGVDIAEDPLAAKRKIGYLPEQPPVYPEMTVEEYLNFVYDLKGVKLPREAHLSDIMSAVKLRDVQKRLIRNLSKGYRQRVGIAEALVGNPPILIFDEPTVGLDPKQIIEIRNLLRTLGKNHTVILSTHILSEVQAVCERILVIDRGRLIADEKTADLSRTIEGYNRYLCRIVSPVRSQVLDKLRGLPGVKGVTVSEVRDADASVYTLECEPGIDFRKPLFRLCVQMDWPLLGLEKEESSLEEIFLRLLEKPADKVLPKRKKGRSQTEKREKETEE